LENYVVRVCSAAVCPAAVCLATTLAHALTLSLAHAEARLPCERGDEGDAVLVQARGERVRLAALQVRREHLVRVGGRAERRVVESTW